MKTALMIVLSILNGYAALAAPTPPPKLAGTYSFAGEANAIPRKRYEVVYAFTEAGRAELEKLQKAMYECRNSGREIYLCSKFLPVEGDAKETAERRTKAKLAATSAVFGMRNGEAELITKGEEGFEEWLVRQPVTVLGVHYDSYRFLRGQGLEKLSFGESAEDGFVLEKGRLMHYDSETVNLSREVREEFFVESAFVK